jgi:hypothetical protein
MLIELNRSKSQPQQKAVFIVILQRENHVAFLRREHQQSDDSSFLGCYNVPLGNYNPQLHGVHNPQT